MKYYWINLLFFQLWTGTFEPNVRFHKLLSTVKTHWLEPSVFFLLFKKKTLIDKREG